MSSTTGSTAAARHRGPIDGALRAPMIAGAGLACAGCFVATTDPSDGIGLLPCPFRTLTGWWCPGCGLTRATHHLVRGDLRQALRYNVFVVVVLGAIVVAWVTWVRAAASGSSTRPVRPALVAVATIVALVFAVVRNLPGVRGFRG